MSEAAVNCFKVDLRAIEFTLYGHQAALVAETKRAANDDGAGQGEDDDFYTGKVLAAKYYVNFVLPLVHAKVGAIVTGDRSALDMPDAGFSAAH